MKKGNKRSTPEEIEQMKYLYKKGWSSVKIGKKFGKCHQTVLFNVGKLKRKPGRPFTDRSFGSHIYNGIGGSSSEIPGFIKKNLEERENERLERIGVKKVKKDKTKCVVCGEEKNKKFRLTNVCSLKCFADNYVQRKFPKSEVQES